MTTSPQVLASLAELDRHYQNLSDSSLSLRSERYGVEYTMGHIVGTAMMVKAVFGLSDNGQVVVSLSVPDQIQALRDYLSTLPQTITE